MFADALADMIREQPQAPAMISRKEVLTYAGLGQRLLAGGKSLEALDMGSNARVGLGMRHGVDHLLLILCLLLRPATSVAIHGAWPDEMRHDLAAALGLDWFLHDRLSPGIRHGRSWLIQDGFFSQAAAGSPNDVEAERGARVFFSSGSTGQPKPLLFDAGYLDTRIRQTIKVSKLGPASRMLCGDLNFAAWCIPALATLAVGGCLVFSHLNSSDIMRALVYYRVTHARLSPAFLSGLLDKAGRHPPHLRDMARLEVVGGSLSTDLRSRLGESISDQVYLTYGMTEFGFVSIADPAQLKSCPRAVGRPLPDVEVQILNESGNPLGAGEVGELRLRSAAMLPGYLDQAGPSEKHFKGGWYFPGDLGEFDENGLLLIRGRADTGNTRNRNPHDLYHIEQATAEFSGVLDAVAFVLKDGTGGKLTCVALRERDLSKGLMAYLREHLGDKAPDMIARLNGFPMTPNGKVDRAALRALVQAQFLESSKSATPKKSEHP
jgi:acyl-coenzyme A synthetase/AMP-(fatty) acid ligase